MGEVCEQAFAIARTRVYVCPMNDAQILDEESVAAVADTSSAAGTALRVQEANGQQAGAIRGREAVRSALLAAATELFAESGPRGVSVREIAAKAGVHYTLIYRHFGSRDELVREVFQQMITELGDSLQGQEEDRLARITDAVAERPFLWRLMVQGLLDRQTKAFSGHKQRYLMEMLDSVAQAQSRGEVDASLDGELITTMGLALVMGWLVLEDHLPYLPLGKGRSVQELRCEARKTWWQLLSPRSGG